MSQLHDPGYRTCIDSYTLYQPLILSVNLWHRLPSITATIVRDSSAAV